MDRSFAYEPIFQRGEGNASYRFLGADGVEAREVSGEQMLFVDPEVLTELARTAFLNVSHLLRTRHLEQLSSILRDPESSENDRFVARELMKNAIIAADYVFPGCQDTGTAAVMGKRGDRVMVRGDDAEALSRGVFQVYSEANLRYSQVAPLSFFEEKNTGTNLPAQIDLYAAKGAKYEFLFVAKGGGSANKFFLFQETKALLREDRFLDFVWEKIQKIGTAACPPYHLAFVVGGTSAEATMKAVKLATTGYYDDLPTTGSPGGRAFRDREMEQKVLQLTRDVGIGAQFGGKYFCHDVKVLRLPRHGASCPVGMGVSCSADRNILARIDAKGVWLEQLETNPARLLPEVADGHEAATAVRIDLTRPMDEVRAELSKHPVGTALLLSGSLIVARDSAHAKLLARLEAGDGLPDYLRHSPVYYAGPAKTPDGHASGSFGPTTAQRMDPYVAPFQAAGGSLVMLAKGNRGAEVTASCAKHGGFYLGSIGGPAARLGRDCIKKIEVVEYKELGMEAIRRIEVEDFPAFIVVDDKGNDFFADLRKPTRFVTRAR